jgi:hypothetical protein
MEYSATAEIAIGSPFSSVKEEPVHSVEADTRRRKPGNDSNCRWRRCRFR